MPELTDDQIEGISIHLCTQHRMVILAYGTSITSRPSPGHRGADCAECDAAVASAFAAIGGGS
jgi:hypothetical protein